MIAESPSQRKDFQIRPQTSQGQAKVINSARQNSANRHHQPQSEDMYKESPSKKPAIPKSSRPIASAQKKPQLWKQKKGKPLPEWNNEIYDPLGDVKKEEEKQHLDVP